MSLVKFKDLDITGICDCIVFLDIDGTLVYDKGQVIDKEIIDKVCCLSIKNNVFLCSNSKDIDRNTRFKQILNINSVSGLYRKPGKRLLSEAVKLLDAEYSGDLLTLRKVVIGDTNIIDGRFAKNINADFIKVGRIQSINDNLYARFFYLVDKIYTLFFVR